MYTEQEVLEYVRQEDVKFIRLAFCDVFGTQKNISIMPGELKRGVESGMSFDASAVRGFGAEDKSDLFLVPDPSTLSLLPWRPSQGRVVRLFCGIRRPDGTPLEADCRQFLKDAVRSVREAGYTCRIGAEFEFYLLKTDEAGRPTRIPFDQAGYMDVAPEDAGENMRREICLTLEEMGILPESSHHEEGPGQNEIDFKHSDPLTAADNAVTFKSVVQNTASRNGLYASFSPKPLDGQSGSGLHINLSLKSADGTDGSSAFMAGILAHIAEITAFLNPTRQSYQRLGSCKAPKYIAWSPENRSPLIRIPAVRDSAYARMEVRSPDPEANPYLAYALLLLSGLDGIRCGMKPPPPVDFNLYQAPASALQTLPVLPGSLEDAVYKMTESEFVRRNLPRCITEAYRHLIQ